jgi:hypothetical protein
MKLHKILTENRPITLTNSGSPSPLKFAKIKSKRKIYISFDINTLCFLWVDDTDVIFPCGGLVIYNV